MRRHQLAQHVLYCHVHFAVERVLPLVTHTDKRGGFGNSLARHHRRNFRQRVLRGQLCGTQRQEGRNPAGMACRRSAHCRLHYLAVSLVRGDGQGVSVVAGGVAVAAGQANQTTLVSGGRLLQRGGVQEIQLNVTERRRCDINRTVFGKREGGVASQNGEILQLAQNPHAEFALLR